LAPLIVLHPTLIVFYHRIRALNDATFAGTAALQDLPTPTLEDVNWMLAESNKFMTRQVQRNEVLASWSGKSCYTFSQPAFCAD
jgi:hypothetical protein